MKRSVVLGVAIGAIVIAVAGVGYWALQVGAKGSEQDRKADVVTTSRAVDDKLTAIWARLAECDTAWETAIIEPSLSGALEASTAEVEEIRTDVEDARALVAKIPSDEVQKAYTRTCDELDRVLEVALTNAQSAAPLCEAHQMLMNAADNDKAGWDLLNDSIEACNKDDYAQGRTHAVNAEAQYQAMRDAYSQAVALSGVSAVEAAYPYIDAHLEYARMHQQLADLGAKGGVNSYNAHLDKMKAQMAVVMGMNDTLIDADAALLEAVFLKYGLFVVSAEDAKDMWDSARDLISSGDV